MRVLAIVLFAAAAAQADVAVAVHGTLREAREMKVDAKDLIVPRGKKENRYPLAEYYLVEKEDGTLLWSGSFADRVRGYGILARHRRRGAYVKLLKPAIASRDTALARQLLELAEQNGYTGKDAEKLKYRLEVLEKKNRTPNEAKAKRVRADMAKVAALYVDLLFARAQKEKSADDSLRLLREVLRASPQHAEALAQVKARVPKDFKAGDARFWLDWRLDLELQGAKFAPDDTREMYLARKRWRKDVIGILLGPVRMITPVRDTRAIASCIAYAALTCKVLGELFKPEKPMKRVATHLTVFLMENKKEYETTTGTGRKASGRNKFTAGHYSPSEQLSRVYWESKPDAERRIARVFVHEMTHHWLAEMNPCYSDSQRRPRGGMPGAWIGEGFATFLEEGRYDIRTGWWDLFDGRNSALDIVAALSKDGKLLPWKDVYESNHIQFMALGRGKKIEFVRRWAAGRELTTPIRLFYEQSAATCMFLYHGENGRYRKQLMDFVVNHYMGKRDKMPTKAAFGLTPAQLGAKVEAFAKKVASGWRPKK